MDEFKNLIKLKDFAHYCKTPIKVKGSRTGKIMCKHFDPKKHINLGEKTIISFWSEIETTKSLGFRNVAMATMFVFVQED